MTAVSLLPEFGEWRISVWKFPGKLSAETTAHERRLFCGRGRWNRETWQPGTMSPSLFRLPMQCVTPWCRGKRLNCTWKCSNEYCTAAGAAIRTDVCDCGLWV